MAEKTINQILKDAIADELLALFTFEDITPELLVIKFNLWTRYFFSSYFQSPDADFHKKIDLGNARAYLGELDSFTNLGFRGNSKTTRTKLFVSFVIANDLLRRKRYFKALSQDGGNSKQIVTDVYNSLIEPRVKLLYPAIFAKTETKREETMSSFTTATGIKLIADTVGAAQRGQIQEDARPDFIIFDDYETRTTISSSVVTKKIWDNMEEARNGLAVGGACIYLGNYISERGNVHKLVKKEGPRDLVINTPIWDENLNPTWSARYSKEAIESIKNKAEDFEGEYLGKPSAGGDILFDRIKIDSMPSRSPIREIGEFKIFKNYNPSHRYAAGADIAGGVGLDSSTSVFIDFDTIPAQVVATYHSNTIKPDIFGDELARQGDRFGQCLLAPENNKFDMCIGRLKQIYPLDKIFIQPRDSSKVQERQGQSSMTYGWNTNSATKPKMIFALAKAIEDGLLELNDPDLKEEIRSYTRNDLMDRDEDPRLVTRHFDLLVAAAIAWQMKDYVGAPSKGDNWTPPIEQPGEYEGVYIPPSAALGLGALFEEPPYEAREHEL